jgi:hypothetical protein
LDGAGEIQVDCVDRAGGWTCTVHVGGDPGATTHHVSVSSADLERLAGAGVEARQLVEESFAFMLEREPRESILREFELPLIGRYFPEYEGEIRRRLGG